VLLDMKTRCATIAEMTPYLVGIAGGTASGKTTLAQRLLTYAGDQNVAVIELDRYYRCQDDISMSERVAANYDHPSSIEFDLLIEQLKQLKAGHTIQTPIYDFEHHTRKKDQLITVEPRPVIIVEGILVFAIPELRDLFGTRIFVDAPSDVRLKRRLERDTRERGRTAESVMQQWDASVHPMYLEFCEPSRETAEIVFDGITCCDAPLDSLWEQLREAASRSQR
jgi:uridine kinase